MQQLRPVVLSIAGLDPSGGAGLLADVKTFESNKVYGLGVASALTVQNDIAFEKVEWVDVNKIIEQIETLKKRFKIEYVKIGLIENPDVLYKLIMFLKASPNSELRTPNLIWDPILKASAGFEFHKKPEKQLLEKICKELYLITPNVPEVLQLGETDDAMTNAKYLRGFCNVYLKGGHNETDKGRDHLFTKEGKQFSFRSKLKTVYEKHGSGCVLSSAITANLVKGHKLHGACLRGKDYTAKFLMSNKTLLGYHKI